MPLPAQPAVSARTRPSRGRWSGRGGFTIFEVGMAGAILALAIATSLTTVQRAFLSLDTARNLTTAGQILQCEIEKMRLVPWSSTLTLTGIADYTNTVPAPTVDPIFTSNNRIGSRFTLTRSVTTPESEVAQITLTATWRNYDGRPLSRSYTTYYSRYGLYDYFYNTTY